ncbi:MAG TPA: hypothetical protein VLV76_01995 [Candidatus Acidoferrum sp.]|nr:hypothetical protein [Candidatus Acidoferrum sp.]
MILSAFAFALLLGGFIFLVLPRGRLWQRTASAALFILLVAVVYGGSAELLGRPKPMRLEWRDPQHAQVLGSSMRENDAIYVWLQFDDGSEPRAYRLPWSIETAQQLQTATQEGEANGTGVQMTMSAGDSGLDQREPKFYATPQAALPDKSYGRIGPLSSNR